MAVYAVKKGKKTGKFPTWNECAKYVIGVPHSEYKKCLDDAEADEYLGVIHPAKFAGLSCITPTSKQTPLSTAEMYRNIPQELLASNEAVAYIGGSYKDGFSGSSVVFVTKDNKVTLKGSCVEDENTMKYSSVSSKLMAVIMAVLEAEDKGFEKITIVYDYLGIQQWATGRWLPKTKLAHGYSAFMKEHGKKIAINFVWLKAQSSKVKYSFFSTAAECAKKVVDEHRDCSISTLVHKIFDAPKIPATVSVGYTSASSGDFPDVPF